MIRMTGKMQLLSGVVAKCCAQVDALPNTFWKRNLKNYTTVLRLCNKSIPPKPTGFHATLENILCNLLQTTETMTEH